MEDVEFRNIAPHCGGRPDAFEELCCQLARRTLPEGTDCHRLRGAGGDGGVECFADLPDGDTQGTVRRRRKVGAADSEKSKGAGV